MRWWVMGCAIMVSMIWALGCGENSTQRIAELETQEAQSDLSKAKSELEEAKSQLEKALQALE